MTTASPIKDKGHHGGVLLGHWGEVRNQMSALEQELLSDRCTHACYFVQDDKLKVWVQPRGEPYYDKYRSGLMFDSPKDLVEYLKVSHVVARLEGRR